MSSEGSFDNVEIPLSPTKTTGSGDAEEQLQKVYQILSQSFSRDVASVSDVQAVIKAFINKYLKTKNQLKEQNEMNEQLTSQLQQSMDQTQIDEADKEQLAANEEELTKKLKQYKKRVIALQQQISGQEAQTVEAQTRIRELELRLEDEEREKAKLIEELSQAQQQLNKEEPAKPDVDPVEETAKLFEDIVSGQAQEIEDLVHQRDILIENVRSLDGAVREAENFIQSVISEKSENEKIISELKEKNSELNNVLPQLAQEIEQKIPHDLRSSLPQIGPDAEKYIFATIDALVSSRSVANKEDESEKTQEDVVPKEKYVALLAKLEDAIRYIQNIAKPGDKAQESCPLGIDADVRNNILTQCARIGHFVDENMVAVGVENLPLHLSLFEPGSLSSAEEQLKEFLEFTTQEQLSESPIRELFALFSAVCEVNKMMMNYSEKLKNQTQQQERTSTPANSDVVRNLQRDNFDLAQWKAVNQERINAATEILQRITQDDGQTAMDVMVQDLGKRYEETVAELDDLKQKHETLIQEKKELEESVQTTIQEAEEKVQTREISFQEEQKTHEDISRELETKVSVLETSNDKLKQKLQATSESYEAALREKSTKLRKALQAQTETKKMLDAIQERTDAIVQENEQLHSVNQEMEETLNAQKEQLIAFAENERKLRDSRENLKKRISVAETANKTTIQEIKQRNDELQQKYQETLSSLQKELDEKKSLCDVLKEENEKAKKERMELSQTITNLRVTERALQLKIRTNAERQALEKSAAEARNNTYMISLKAQAVRQIDESKAQLEQTRQTITKILAQQFNEQAEEDASFSDLFNRLDRRLQMFTADKRILADAIKLRGELKVPANVSLSEQWAIEQQAKANAENSSIRSQNERRAVETELNNLKRATEKISSDAKEANEWEHWGRSLYKQVNETSAEIPVQELRFKLSEDVLAAVKDRSTLKRLDSLRAQKKILSNPLINEPAQQGAELCMKSVVGILIFAQRIQGTAGVPLSPRK